MPVRVTKSDGSSVDPGAAVTPIFLSLEPGLFKVIGTGFYVTRYGLLITAKHVVEDLIDSSGTNLRLGYVWHFPDKNTVHFRRIVSIAFDKRAPTHSPDIAMCQADNHLNEELRTALMNERIALTTAVPEEGEPVATYAYPNNAVVDCRPPEKRGRIFADFFEGRFIARLNSSDRPYIRYPHYETSMEIQHGSSGGPVFSAEGHAFAVNCRGWNFKGAEQENDNLSSVIDVSGLSNLLIPVDQIPSWSAEHKSVPEDRRGQMLRGQELVKFGHITLHAARIAEQAIPADRGDERRSR